MIWAPGQFRVEVRALATLALPIVVAQTGIMLMGVVDTMMVGRLSEQALAAVAIAHAIHMTVIMLAIGVLLAVNTFVAQDYGAGNAHRIGTVMQQGFVQALVFAVPVTVFLAFLEPTLELLRQQPALHPEAAAYGRGLAPGVVAGLLFANLRQALQGTGAIRPLLISVVVGNAINVVANYALIFGHFGLPAFGVQGSAFATSLCRWVMLAVLVAGSARPLGPYWRGFGREAFDLGGHWRILRVGVPITVKMFVEMGVFTTVTLIMGNLGVLEAAGHQIAINLASLTFMVPLGVSIAATTRVGQAIGARDPEGARRAAVVAMVMGVLSMSCTAVLFGVLPRALASLYTDQAAVLALAASLLPIAALFQVFDGVQVVAGGVLRGAADTALPAVLALLGYWGLGLPLGIVLGLRGDLGAVGLWWGLTAGLACVAILLLGRVVVRMRGPLEPVQATVDKP